MIDFLDNLGLTFAVFIIDFWRISTLANMSVDLKKTASNGHEKVLVPQEQQGKVCPIFVKMAYSLSYGFDTWNSKI